MLEPVDSFESTRYRKLGWQLLNDKELSQSSWLGPGATKGMDWLCRFVFQMPQNHDLSSLAVEECCVI